MTRYYRRLQPSAPSGEYLPNSAKFSESSSKSFKVIDLGANRKRILSYSYWPLTLTLDVSLTVVMLLTHLPRK